MAASQCRSPGMMGLRLSISREYVSAASSSDCRAKAASGAVVKNPPSKE